jgi:DNA-binding winged helix-turn-helix (wHTH) protein
MSEPCVFQSLRKLTRYTRGNHSRSAPKVLTDSLIFSERVSESRMSQQNTHVYKFGPFRLDPLKRRLSRDGELVRLTPKAFDLLLVLVEDAGRTVEKEELFEKVWPGIAVEENNLNQNITALRKSLGDSRKESQYIATIPGVGYRFVAEVTKLAENLTQPDQSVAEQNAAENVRASCRWLLSRSSMLYIRARNSRNSPFPR